jgi:hypothetical protein
VGSVAYVAAGGTANTMCEMSDPCRSVTTAVSTGKPNIKITGTIDERLALDSLNRVIVGAPGARLTRSPSVGEIVSISGSGMVTIAHLTIGGAPTVNVGITVNGGVLTLEHVTVDSCVNGGIHLSSGRLQLYQSILSNNPGGGLDVTTNQANFDIQQPRRNVGQQRSR